MKAKYSAKQLCDMYPKKYIAINNIIKDKNNIITNAKILKIYDTLDDCKNHIDEIKFLQKINKNDFDIIYGDYEDYLNTRKLIKIDAFSSLGAIAFELCNPNFIDDILKSIKNN